VADIGALARFRNTKEVAAGDGRPGGTQYRDGQDGEDVDFPVPVGTVIHDLNANKDTEIIAVGQRVMLAKGGHGGRGNFHYRSSTDTSPRTFGPGTDGQKKKIRLELKLIADVGLVGLPNAGKSSLMNELTRAKQKVANYPFTTLEPGLGAYYDLILADIPGLIEGASTGKGLGTKFLRHIERTKTIFHLVSCESADPLSDYRMVREELEHHNRALTEKAEHVFLTKTDMVAPEKTESILKDFASKGIEATPISIHDMDSLQAVHSLLRELIKAKATL
jgi:GTP-binding protein